MSAASRLNDHIPEPHLFLLGCQPLVPAPARPTCPVCHGLIGVPRLVVVADESFTWTDPRDHGTYCGRCDAMSPANESRIVAARVGLKARSKTEVAEQQATVELRRHPNLTELERRRLWNGYRGGILSSGSQVTNRARVGREWLKSIGQEPDWNLILDAQGRVVGRYMD